MFVSISEKWESSQAGEGEGGLGDKELGCGPGNRSLILCRNRSEACQTCSQIIEAGTELFPQN